jgi:hypothetical protein
MAIDTQYLYVRRGRGDATDRVQRFALQSSGPPVAIDHIDYTDDLPPSTGPDDPPGDGLPEDPLHNLQPLSVFPSLITPPAVTLPVSAGNYEKLAQSIYPPGSSQSTYTKIAIYYGDHVNGAQFGSLQQVYIYDRNGNVLDVIGVPGGYNNGPAVPQPTGTGDATFKTKVKLGGYIYDIDPLDTADPPQNPLMVRQNRATVCFQADGSLWVQDTATSRMLLFGSSGNYLNEIMYLPQSYRVAVDPNDTSRVFSYFLEFSVDYAKPLRASWRLKNYWGHHIWSADTSSSGPVTRARAGNLNGLLTVTTVPNGALAGRTFAIIFDPSAISDPGGTKFENNHRLVELVQDSNPQTPETYDGLRSTAATKFFESWELEADGSVNTTEFQNALQLLPDQTGDGNYAATSVSHPFFANNAVTVEFWMKTSDTTHGGTPFGYFGGGAPVLWLSDYRNFRVRVGANTSAALGVSANDGVWHHIALTWAQTTGPNLKLYKDGLQVSATTLSTAYNLPDSGFFIVGCKDRCAEAGRVCVATDAYLGQIRDVRVWNRVLNPSEIAAETPSTVGLVGRWMFHDENVNNPTEADVSGNNRWMDLERVSDQNGPDYRTPWLVKFVNYPIVNSGGQIQFAPSPTFISDRQIVSASDPIENHRTFKRHGNNLILFTGEKSHSGPHLAALPISGSRTRGFAWTKMSAEPLKGKGEFDPNANDNAARFTLLNDDLFILYPGEFWKGGRQANQIMHFRATDGTFLGQCGMPLYQGVTINPPGSANNLMTAPAVRFGSKIYLYTNDEIGRGVHRWQITSSANR